MNPAPSCQPALPKLAMMLFELTIPKGDEEEAVQDLEEKFQSWAIPRYGKLAPLWAYGQAVRGLVVVAKEAVLELAERFRKIAR